MIIKNYTTPLKNHLAQAVGDTKRIEAGSSKPKAMTLVIKHLFVQPHTCASLVKKIGVYSASHINHCLRKLRKSGLIGAVWDFKQKAHVYYNIKLEKVE